MKTLKIIIGAVLFFCIFGSAKPGSLYNSKEIKDSIEIKIDTLIAHAGLSAETPGGVVGVIKDGKFIFKKAYGLANFETKEPITTSTLFNLASVSKQFTAAAVLILVREKKLSLKDDIRKYIPDFPDYGYPITVEDLIHHTCGIKSYDVLKLMAGTLFSKETPDEVYSLIIKQSSLNFIPGDEYLYSNSGYVLLAKIIENTSGMKASKFIEEKIFRPCGMNQSLIYDYPGKIILNSASGHTWGGENKFKRSAELNSTVVGESNVYTCAEDFLEWDNNFYNNGFGDWNFRNEMISRITLRNGDTCNYAFGLEISEHNGLKTISHQGGTGDFTAQYIQIPSEKFAVVCLFNIPIDVEGLAYKITDLFVKGNEHPNVSVLPEKVKVDSFRLQTYVGKYFNEKLGAELNITREGDHLVFDALYHGRLEIYPFSDSSFFTTVADIKFIFSKNDKGEISKTTLIQDNRKYSFNYMGTNVSSLEAEQLKQFAGDYYCKDIDVTYPVIFKDNKLYVTFPESTAEFCKIKPETELLSEHTEYFDSPVSAFQFTRNAGNEISGLIIKDLGRVRNLEFSKTK